MKKGITTLIPQNVAPSTVKSLAIYDSNGKKVCELPLGHLKMPTMGQKLYSFGALADIHMTYETAEADFRKALKFFNETEKVDFITICGDLTQRGIDEQMAIYKEIAEESKAPVYEEAGNHESYAEDWTQNGEAEVVRLMQTYTGRPLHYVFTQGDDVFIMMGICSDTADFGTGGLQWLYEVLEANRNKRCFLFQHIRPDDTCGNAFGIYKNDIWNGTQSVVFENLLKHYRNVIFLHGHSHMKLSLQTKNNLANYDNKYGMHSIHIPSLVAPRTGNLDGTGRTELYAESEGYVVDVYEKHIVLRGYDFVADEFIPVAQYCLETKLVEIEANTFTDSTGTIKVA